ncbi:MAG: porin family protein [Dysgonomonas sp.]
MKIKKYIILSLMALFTIPMFGIDPNKLEHRIVVGFNLGATTPTSIPVEVRELKGWWPQFTPQLGYNILYKTDTKWGVGTGILLDYKGMGAKVRAKYIHTKVEYDGSLLEGYFVGTNETRVKTAHVTIPLFATYSFNDKWRVRAGGYASYAFSTSFKGEVYDGYLRVDDPTGTKIEFKDGGKATFDFSSDIRDFDFGVLVGGEMKLNQKFNLYGNLSWGLRPIFSKEKRVMDFDMYNIYFALGVAYKL